jgi:hypothetical protein
MVLVRMLKNGQLSSNSRKKKQLSYLNKPKISKSAGHYSNINEGEKQQMNKGKTSATLADLFFAYPEKKTTF